MKDGQCCQNCYHFERKKGRYGTVYDICYESYPVVRISNPHSWIQRHVEGVTLWCKKWQPQKNKKIYEEGAR